MSDKMTDEQRRKLNEYLGNPQPDEPEMVQGDILTHLKDELNNLLEAAQDTDVYSISMLYYALAIADLDYYLQHQEFASKALSEDERHGRALAVLRDALKI